MNEASRPEKLPQSEWETHLTLVTDAIAQMESYLATPSYEGKQSIQGHLTVANNLN